MKKVGIIMGSDSDLPIVQKGIDMLKSLEIPYEVHIYSALGALSMGCEILAKENVEIDSVCGHGGFFKVPVVGQSAMSAAIGAPVTVMNTAGEGGAWGNCRACFVRRSWRRRP